MQKSLIVANWKLNPNTQKEAEQLFDAVKNIKHENADVVICPPFVYLSLLKVEPGADLYLGAQSVSAEEKGAFTGEVSALQLKDLGVEYVIVGHSERRKYFGETGEVVAKKLQAVLNAGMTPILCIDNENQIPTNLSSNAVVAYEPLWAIGTGKNCEPADVKKMVEIIKNLAGEVKVLYGGSVNASNAKEYIENGGVDGLLVGGASLKADEFIKIVESV